MLELWFWVIAIICGYMFYFDNKAEKEKAERERQERERQERDRQERERQAAAAAAQLSRNTSSSAKTKRYNLPPSS